MDPQQVGFVTGLGLGGLIVIAGCVAGFVAVSRHTKKKIAAFDLADPGARTRPAGDMIPLFYVLSVMFWPAAFILGSHLMREAHTARAGRTCLLIGVGVITTVAVLTSVAMVVLTILFDFRLPI